MLFQTNVLLFIERMLSLSDDKKALCGLPNRRAGNEPKPGFMVLIFKSKFFHKVFFVTYMWGLGV